MTELQSLILGVVQGVTEFLPISSSGHLLLAKQYIGIPDTPIVVDVLLHLATLVVVVWYFRAVLLTIIKQLSLTIKYRLRVKSNTVIIVILKLAVASACTALIGGTVYAVLPLDNLTVTGVGYVLTAILLGVTFIVVKRRARAEGLPSIDISSTTQHEVLVAQTENAQRPNGELILDALSTIPWKTVVLLGVVQGCAVIPGISRAGSTIATARMSGLPTGCAVPFSFLLAIPAIGGAMITQLFDLQLNRHLLIQSVWGMIAAIVCGYGALLLLDKLLIAKSKQVLFIPYLIFLAIVSFYGIR